VSDHHLEKKIGERRGGKGSLIPPTQRRKQTGAVTEVTKTPGFKTEILLGGREGPIASKEETEKRSLFLYQTERLKVVRGSQCKGMIGRGTPWNRLTVNLISAAFDPLHVQDF